MFTFGLAAVVFVVFLAGVVREPRSFGNAVLLGLLIAVAVGPFLVACFLLGNGVTMARREGLRPANLLALVAGAAAFAVIGLDVAADRAGDLRLSLFATVANLVFGYVSFLLVSYVCYAFGYGLLTRPGKVDFVIVLGAGLRPDGGVPPLLASRLDRGREVWAALDRRAAAAGSFRPMIIVSGGKGDDERVPEARAMAAYLAARGVPADRLAQENQSRSTEENLRFSRVMLEELRPGARATIVTSDFHAFRAALIARRVGLRAQATGARVAGYYEPNAVLREFAAVFLRYRVVNLGICAVLVVVPLAAGAIHLLLSR